MTQRIAKLEALLARIKANAASPRIQPAAEEQHDEPVAHAEAEREVEAPLESRARLVAAPQAEPEEIQADDVLKLDDRHVVPDTRDAAFAQTIQAQTPLGPEHEEPPPSSRRPIAEPAETPQEAQIQVAHTPPPESGKQVATDALSFDDDFTGVREASAARTAVTEAKAVLPEPSIQLQSLRMPAVKVPTPVDEMEVQLPSTNEATRPPPGPLPDMRVPEPAPAGSVSEEPAPMTAEVSRPTRPVAAAHVADMPRAVPVPSPKTFGELIDLTLSL